MAGKASLILVLGFSMIFLVMGGNMISVTSDMDANYYGYYYRTVAHNIAVSGANVMVNQLFFNKNWMTTDTVKMSGGRAIVTIEALNTYNRKITSCSVFNNSCDTVIVIMTPMNYAQYGNFYTTCGSTYWATGDSLSGPFYTNDYINVTGSPVFLGKASTKKGLNKQHSYDTPQFLGGFESGVDIPLDFDTSSIRVAAYNAGKIFRDTTGHGYNTDVNLLFNSNGTVTYKVNINNSGWTATSTKALSALTSNGVIYVEKGNIYVQGTVKGATSIVASSGNGGTGSGNVYITDDIKYSSDPRINASSTDMLGICAEQNLTVKYNSSTADLDIQASMFIQKGGLIIENYSSYPTVHNMNILGGVIAHNLNPTASYNAYGNPTNGYRYVQKFDSRFLNSVPPYFPQTKYFKVISWYE